ncbi:MAG: ribonuclease E/G, partial [Pseudomonadota bacterium]
GYRNAKDFMKMIMPSHAKNVKNYQDGLPLFARHQVESYLDGMFNPTVQLRSGGYIVIGITEALVAIDVNSGKATKEGSIEETALKTNLEAAEEVARQLRLRDLAGLIVIDFIDMEDRRNNAKVEKMMKEKLKTDRARIQVGRISGFGLMEMSRQRLRPGMLEASTQPCPHCHGTGLIRSDESMGLTILRQLEEEGTRRKSREVLVTAPVKIANFLINQKREYIAQIEARHGLSVRVEADPHMISPDFTVEKFKTATRAIPEAPVITGDASLMEDFDEPEMTEAETSDAPESGAGEEGDGQQRKKRRRRRRRRGGSGGQGGSEAQSTNAPDETSAAAEEASGDAAEEVEATDNTAPETGDDTTPKKRTRTRSRSRGGKKAAEADAAATPSEEAAPVTPAEDTEVAASDAEGETAEADAPAPKKRTRRSRAKPKAAEEAAAPPEVQDDTAQEPAAEAAPALEDAPAVEEASPAEPAPEPQPEAAEAAAPEVKSAYFEDPVSEPEPEPEPEVAPDVAAKAPPEQTQPAKPKRKGWWSFGQ